MVELTVDRKLVLAPSEAAALLGRGTNEVRSLLAAGELRGWRTGGGTGHWRIPRQALDAYIAKQLDEAN